VSDVVHSSVCLSNSIEQSASWDADSQLVSKFSTSNGTWRFITMFRRACHWSLSSARCIQSTTSHPISIRSILILSYHLCQGLPHGLFPSCFPTKILYVCMYVCMYACMHACMYCIKAYKLHSSSSYCVLQPATTSSLLGSQILELSHIFKGFISIQYIVILSCILVMWQNHILHSLCIYL